MVNTSDLPKYFVWGLNYLNFFLVIKLITSLYQLINHSWTKFGQNLSVEKRCQNQDSFRFRRQHCQAAIVSIFFYHFCSFYSFWLSWALQFAFPALSWWVLIFTTGQFKGQQRTTCCCAKKFWYKSFTSSGKEAMKEEEFGHNFRKLKQCNCSQIQSKSMDGEREIWLASLKISIAK